MPPAVQLLILVAALVLFWAIVMRPARNQQRTVAQLQSELEVGDEVILSAGIFGVVRSVDDSMVRLEVATDTVITVARQVVVRRAPEPDPAATVQPDQPAADAQPGVRPATDEESE